MILQTSTSLYSLACTLDTRSSNVPKSGSLSRWTSSQCVLHLITPTYFCWFFFFLFRVYPHQKRPKHQKSHQLRSWKRLLHFCSSFPELYYPSSIPPCIIHTVVIGIYMLYNIHITLHTHVNALAFLIYTIRCLLHLHLVWLNSNSCEWGEMR